MSEKVRLGANVSGRARVLVAGFVLLATVVGMVGVVEAVGQSSMTVGASGSVAGADDASVVDVQLTAPITMSGQTSTLIESRWSASQAVLTSDAIVRPEGWNLEYTTDGSAWSSTAPTPLSSVVGIRSAGSVRSQGLDSAGLQVSSKPSSGTTLPVSGEIQGGAGGDGYGITFADTRVLNVWHHATGTITVDCHLRATGAQCPRVVFNGPYANGNHSPAGWESTSKRLFTPVVNTSSAEFGFLCADYSLATPAPCAVPFVAVSAVLNPAPSVGADLGGAADDGSRFYLVDSARNRLYCLDMVMASPCADFGLSGFATTTHPGTWIGGTQWASDVAVIGGRVYLIIGDTLGCVDPTVSPVAWCGGNQPISINGNPQGIFNVPPFPVYDSSGGLSMVCEFMGRNCIDSSGATSVMPTALSNFIATTPIPSTYFLYSVFESTVKENKLFWPTELGGVSSANWSNDAACFDFSTASPCPGGDAPGVKYDVSLSSGASGRVYAFAADPDPDISCIWVNGDAGVISTFSTDLGSCSGNTTVRFSYDEVVPRMSCAEPGRVREWRDLVLTLPNGVSASDLRLTIKDSGTIPQTISGWNRRQLSSTTIDLSSLTVAETGTRPTFLVTAVNRAPQQLTGILADLTYVSDAPQLCFHLAPLATCSLGQPTAGRTAVAPFPVSGSSTAIGASTQTRSMSAVVSDATIDTAACPTGDIGGSAIERESGGALTGVIVRLVDPTTGTTLLTTNTDANGRYSFSGLAEGAYQVVFGSVTDLDIVSSRTVDVTVVAMTTATADASYLRAPLSATGPVGPTEAPAVGEDAAALLPMTGREVAGLVALAAGVLLLGLMLAIGARRAESQRG